MPQDLALPPNTPVTTADVTNAANRNLSLSEIAGRLSDSSDAVIASLGALAAAVTADIIGGSTGATDNLLLRAKGTGGRALDASVVSCDDSGNMSLIASLQLNTGGALRTATSAGNTLLVQARDVDGAAYTTFITLTANNTPTCDLAAAVTKGGEGIATLATRNVWTAQQGFPLATLTDQATITWNAATQQTATVTLGGNRTLGAISNQVAGLTYILIVKQDGTGSRTLAYNANYFFPSGVDPVLSTAAGAIDVLTFVSDGTNMMGVIQKAFA
jgi:hypothetical protein